MAASNSKWRVCDVIVTSRHVIIHRSLAQSSVKLMSATNVLSFIASALILFEIYKSAPPGLETNKKPRQKKVKFVLSLNVRLKDTLKEKTFENKLLKRKNIFEL